LSNTKLKVIDNKELKFNVILDDVELLQSLSKTTKSEKQKIVQTIFELGLKIWKIQSVEVDYQKLDDQREKIVKSFESASKNAESNLSDLTDKLLKGKNGRLALAVDREAKNLEKQLGQLFESDNKKSVPSKIEKVVESTVAEVVSEVLEEIKTITDASDVNSPLSKIKDQILKGVLEPVNKIMEDFEDVSNVIKTHSLVKQEFEKGSNKGLVFEDQVGDILETFTNISGDFIDRVGNTEGASKTGKGKKKGDHVVIVGDADGNSSRVVFEVKNISKKPSVNSVIKLLTQSCKNRQAAVGVYVASTKESAPVQSAFSRLAPNMYSVVVNKETLDTLALEVCYQVSKLEALAKLQQTTDSENIDFEAIQSNLKNLASLTEIVSQIRGNVSKAETDLDDAHGNINNLESQLKDSVSELKKELKK
tara:strand:+ start:109 stop:1374 length:1266 start_codon:yes stop_codon:yes gene_type:complete